MWMTVRPQARRFSTDVLWQKALTKVPANSSGTGGKALLKFGPQWAW